MAESKALPNKRRKFKLLVELEFEAFGVVNKPSTAAMVQVKAAMCTAIYESASGAQFPYDAVKPTFMFEFEELPK